MALGIMQYTQDYDERFPLPWYVYNVSQTDSAMPSYFYRTGDNFRIVSWMDFIHPYVKSVQIYQCPSYKGKPSGNLTADSNYTYSGYVSSAVRTIYSWGGWPYLQPLAASQIQYPSQGMLLMDQQGPYGFYLTRAGWLTRDAYKENYIHFDGDNVAYVDGHVKWVKTSMDANMRGNDKPFWDPT
jgi:hypothetical protein